MHGFKKRFTPPRQRGDALYLPQMCLTKETQKHGLGHISWPRLCKPPQCQRPRDPIGGSLLLWPPALTEVDELGAGPHESNGAMCSASQATFNSCRQMPSSMFGLFVSQSDTLWNRGPGASVSRVRDSLLNKAGPRQQEAILDHPISWPGKVDTADLGGGPLPESGMKSFLTGLIAINSHTLHGLYTGHSTFCSPQSKGTSFATSIGPTKASPRGVPCGCGQGTSHQQQGKGESKQPNNEPAQAVNQMMRP